MFFDDKNKTQVIAKENIINIKEDDNKCFSEIKTVNGEDFITFHHRIFKDSGHDDVKFFDASIYKEMGLSPFEIYLKILNICISNAVLLENFLVKSDKGEKKFTEEIIIPAFIDVNKKNGVKPFIVPLLESGGEGSVCWQHYSHEILQYVKSIDFCK